MFLLTHVRFWARLEFAAGPRADVDGVGEDRDGLEAVGVVAVCAKVGRERTV